MCFVTGARCWEGMVARCPMCVDPGFLKPCWAPSAPPAASLTEKGNYLNPTYHTRKYSVLPLPALPQPPSDGQTCCWASPHWCQELPIWAETFSPARAAGWGQAELFGCYWMPELSHHFLRGKASPWMGSWASSRRSDSCLLSGLRGICWRRQLVVGSETRISGKLLLNF